MNEKKHIGKYNIDNIISITSEILKVERWDLEKDKYICSNMFSDKETYDYFRRIVNLYGSQNDIFGYNTIINIF